MSYISLSFIDLLIAALMIGVNGALSLALGLKLERTLLLNAIRMVVQLTAIGFVLKFIFAQSSPFWTIGLALIMVLFAGYEVMARQSNRLKGVAAYLLSTGTLLLVGFICSFFAIALLLRPDPLYSPQYVLPILGMILGNTMTGVALGMETFTAQVRGEKDVIEQRLSLGFPRFEALKDHMRHAMKTGMMPIINAMAASGIVSLPGMMTGQIIAGVDPVDATKYQLMIMFLIAGGTALGTIFGVIGMAHLLTDDRHRLQLARLKG